MQLPSLCLSFSLLLLITVCDGLVTNGRRPSKTVSEARWRSNRARYHKLFKEAYNERLLQRVMRAQREKTAVGRFATNSTIQNLEQLNNLVRKRRSPHMFSRPLTYHSHGQSKILYFSINGAPGLVPGERSTIAAMFADWSSVTTVCFLERVSMQEQSSVQVRYVEEFAYSATCNCNSKSRSYPNPSSGPSRLIDLNKRFTFLPNPTRPYSSLRVSLPAIILHEVGHTLNVPESSSSTSSAMNRQYNQYSTENFINRYERERVQSIYGKCGGRTDAMLNVLYTRNGELKRVTMVTRESAFWIYSIEKGRPERDFPIRLSQWFSRNGRPIHNTYIKTMFQIYEGSQTGTATPPRSPEFYVVQGQMVHKYRYSHPRATYTGVSVTIYNFTNGAMLGLDAAFWDEKTQKLNMFYGNKVYLFNKYLNLLNTRRINDEFIVPSALDNTDIDEAYQFVKDNEVALAFFRGRQVYAASRYNNGWNMVSRGTVPSLSGGFGWHDLCENLCG